MENNENNVQNQEKKQKKGLSTLLIAVMLIAVLIIGIGGGYLLSKNDNLLNKNETQSNNNNNNESQSQNNSNTDNENKGDNGENKTTEQSKKIDDNKPWVYDAEYLKNKEEKKINLDYSNETYSAISKLKIPYINVNSDEAKKANQEIEKIATEQYNLFGKQDGESTYYITSIDYLYSYNGDTLSILMLYDTSISGTGSNSKSIKSYNLNINNQNDENKNSIGGYSKEVINSKIDEFSKKENSEGDKLKMIDEEYFIYNNQLYVICTGGYTSGGVRSSNQYTLFDVNNLKEIPYYEIKEVLKNKESGQNQTSSNNITSTIAESKMYANVIAEYKKVATEFDIDNFDYNIKTIANIEEFFMINRYPENNSQIGYVYYDIDKNGIKEMITGLYDKSRNIFIPSSIYGYNTTEKKAEKIYHLDTLERGEVNIYDNGIIFSAGSAGATVHIAEFGKISTNGFSYKQLEWVEEEYEGGETLPIYMDLNTKKVLNYKSWDEMTEKYLKDSNMVKFENIEVIEF